MAGPANARHDTSAESLLNSQHKPDASSTYNNEKNPPEDGRKLWTPIFLRKAVLFAFLATFVAFIVALTILFWYSASHHGLATVPQQNYLLWQYGPTAAFTIVAAFWGQVEYRAKQLAPWQLMDRSPQPATHSLLLDFVSPTNLESLVKSLKLPGTRAVATAIAGGFLIKIITILSTGLFILQYIAIEQTARLSSSDDFGGVNTTNFNGSLVDRRAAARVYAINNYSLPFPSGTTDDYAFQGFNTLDTPVDTAKKQGNVNVFHASATCEPLSIRKISSGVSPYYNSSSSDDTVEMVILSFTAESAANGILTWDFTAVIGQIFNNFNTSLNLPVQGNDTYFLVSTGMTNVTYNASSLDPGLVNSSNVLCKPTYEILPGMVTINLNDSITASSNITFSPDAQPSNLTGVTGMELARALFHSSDSAIGMPLSDYLQAIMPGVDSSVFITDVHIYARGIEQLYTSTAAQVADIFFKEPAKKAVDGSIMTMKDRLVVRELTFGLIQGLLIVMIILTGTMIRLVPTHGYTPCDPGPIAGVAAILSRSSDLVNLLRGTGASGISTLHKKLGQGIRWHTEGISQRSDGRFRITKHPGTGRADLRSPEPDSPDSNDPIAKSGDKWFCPFAVTPVAYGLFFIVTIAVIIALEATYQSNLAHNGLFDIGPEQYVNYAYTYVPTAILVFIGLSFACLDFGVRIFQPYDKLHRGALTSTTTTSTTTTTTTSSAAQTRTALYQDYLGKVGLHCLFTSVAQRHIAVIASSIGLVAVPLLTIVVSGLFYIERMPRTQPITLTPTSTFGNDFSGNITHMTAGGAAGWPDMQPVYDKGCAVANLVLLDNTAPPLFTHDGLAFPWLTASAHAGGAGNGDYGAADLSAGVVRARVPARRARANCTLVPTTPLVNMSYPLRSSSSGSEEGGFDYIYVNQSVLCGAYGGGGAIAVREGKFFGSWDTTGMGEWACPNNWITWGQYFRGDAEGENVTAMHCDPYLETVDVDAAFDAKDFSLAGGEAAPVVDERSARDALPVYLWRFSDLLYIDYAGGNSDQETSVDVGDARVDGFFGLLLRGADGPADPGDITGRGNREGLMEAVERTYARVLAQVFNAYRLPADAGTPNITATLETRNRLRLKQSGVSTRILEGLLALLIACAAATRWALRTKDVLPKNPCSVAAVASLLAGSELLRAVPEGAEWLRKREMEKLWEGCFVSMGWWEDGRFGIDVGRAEKEKP